MDLRWGISVVPIGALRAAILAALLGVVLSEGGISAESDWIFSDAGLTRMTGWRALASGDWDDDGRMDLLLSSHREHEPPVAQLWRQDAGARSLSTNFELLASFDLNESATAAVMVDVNRDGIVDTILQLASGDLALVASGYGTETSSGFRLSDFKLPGGRGVVDGPNLDVAGVYGTCGQPSLLATFADNDNLRLATVELAHNDDSCGKLPPAAMRPHHECTIAHDIVPGHTAVADLTGDCVANLVVGVVEGSRIEYFVSEHPPNAPAQCDHLQWKLAKVSPNVFGQRAVAAFSVPIDFGPPAFEDWNSDGAADVAFAACVAANGTTVVACESSSSWNGTVLLRNTVSALCVSGKCCQGGGGDWGFRVSPSPGTHHDGKDVFVKAVGCPAASPVKDVMGVNIVGSRSDAPPTLRPGDFDDDGHADALVSTTAGPAVLHNNGDMTFTCNLLPLPPGVSRAPTTDLNAPNAAPLPDSAHHLAPFFCDVASDGRLDVVLTPVGNASDTLQPSVLVNHAFPTTNYFFTAATLNGGNHARDADGALLPGATQRLQFIDAKQKTRTAAKTQYGSSQANLALPAPRGHFGLAETFSYVTNFATGFRLAGSGIRSQTRQWNTFLLPNSQVVVNPVPLGDPARWSLQLFIKGQLWTRTVLICWVAALVIIGVPLLVLKAREIKADRNERKHR